MNPPEWNAAILYRCKRRFQDITLYPIRLCYSDYETKGKKIVTYLPTNFNG